MQQCYDAALSAKTLATAMKKNEIARSRSPSHRRSTFRYDAGT